MRWLDEPDDGAGAQVRHLALVFSLLLAGTPALANELTPEQAAVVQKFRAINNSLHPQTGDIAITAANVVLHLGKGYYFLPPDEAHNVLVNAWGNPEPAVEGVLGMIFPASGHFYDTGGWAAVVTYDASGFVQSIQHSKRDFDEAEKAIRDSENQGNEERKKLGAPPMHFVGWAQPPRFDENNHTMIWARDLHFGADSTDTLNYDVRALGRRGYVSLNIVAPMPELSSIRVAAESLRQTVEFKPGSRYSDYNKLTDKKSALGIAGLVAAGAGAVLAQKLGLFAVAALFLKKAFVVIIALFAGAAAWFRKLFARFTTRKSSG
jgi:uncharacterized membrane-anchored protein